MKFLIVALFSASAIACPNLAGTYQSCRSDDGSAESYDVVIAQSGNTFEVTSTDAESHERSTEMMVADGRVTTMTANDPTTGMTFTVSSSAVCTGNMVVVSTSVQTEGMEVAALTTQITRQGSAMVEVTSGTAMGQQVNSTSRCQ